MPRQEYIQSLNELQDEILLVGSMVDKAVQRAVEALRTRDAAMAQAVIDADDEVDARQIELEEQVIDIMARQQPMASDLRQLVTALHVADELERMGDYAEGIAKITLLMGEQAPIKPLIDIPRMADIAREMMRDSLDALVARDTESASAVWQRDDEVDELYEQVYRELVTYMIADPKKIERATYLIWVAHNLERIADRATNIAERVIFVSTGQIPTREEWWDSASRSEAMAPVGEAKAGFRRSGSSQPPTAMAVPRVQFVCRRSAAPSCPRPWLFRAVPPSFVCWRQPHHVAGW
jgi:phosphate transport system protein